MVGLTPLVVSSIIGSKIMVGQNYLDKIDPSRIPEHVAIIMDGNGRWAKQSGHERTYGHKHGVEAVRTVLRAANKIGIKVLTLYTFSEENWNRPKEEVEALMNLLVSAVHNELDELNENNVRLEVLGNIEDMPETPKEALYNAIEKTKNNNGCRVVLAINYSGRSEIVRAAKRLVEKGIKEVTEEVFEKELYLPEIPNPDLLIRTGGEFRVSNFLLWQIAYTELYFTSVFWPDFDANELYKAIIDFQGRERRFGMTGEQVSEEK